MRWAARPRPYERAGYAEHCRRLSTRGTQPKKTEAYIASQQHSLRPSVTLSWRMMPCGVWLAPATVSYIAGSRSWRRISLCEQGSIGNREVLVAQQTVPVRSGYFKHRPKDEPGQKRPTRNCLRP